MNKINRLLIQTLIMISVFSGFSCKKLPKETHEGKNTLSCLVDGKKFISGNLNGQDIICSYDQGLRQLRVVGNKAGSQDGIMYALRDINLEVGTYPIQLPIKWASYTENGTTFNSKNGFIKITFLDTTISNQKILAGEFEFVGKDSNGARRNITKGKFDMRLYIDP